MLGGLAATVDDAPVALPADARARELLAYLAVHPGPHSRQRLAGLLRPDVAEESARKTLRDAVYELRRAFAPAEPVVATRETVELRAAVDLAAFQALCAAGDLEASARAAGVTQAREAASGAAGGVRGGGELLPGLDATGRCALATSMPRMWRTRCPRASRERRTPRPRFAGRVRGSSTSHWARPRIVT